MRNFFIVYVAFSALFMSACQADKNSTTTCTVPAVSANIVGTWNATFGGTAAGTATFNSNGTGYSSTSPEGPFTV